MKEKFLIICGYPKSILVFRTELVESLLLRGYELHIAAPGVLDDPKLNARLCELGVEGHDISLNRTGLNPFEDIKTLIGCWALLRKLKPDAVMSYTIKPVIYGSIAAWLAGIRRRSAIITGLGYSFQGQTIFRRILRLFVGQLYAFAISRLDVIFFQNQDDRELFLSRGLMDSGTKSVVVNGSGVNLDLYSVQPIPDGMKFLLVARLLGDKGVREYAAAARQLKERYPYVTFELAGWLDDSPDSVSKDELEEWVNGGYIHFVGFLEDVRPHMAKASVYVLPSYGEGTPRSVLEAMAIGRPIITTDVAGCRETVIDGYNGFLIKHKSADELVSAMEKFIDEPAIIGDMGENSRKMAESKYNVNEVNRIILKEIGL